MSLLTKYRPQTPDELIGREKEWKQVDAALKNGQQSFLFTGPAGMGKTTFSYVLANLHENTRIIEIDGASYSKVDQIRELVDSINTSKLTTNHTAVIIDEVQRLSSSAFDALLKALESPPADVYWILATTEVEKIPKTIQQRCFTLHLNGISKTQLTDFIEDVVEQEGLDVAEDVIDLVVKTSEGSPRQALNNLQAVQGCEDRKQASKLIGGAGNTDVATALRRAYKAYRQGDEDFAFTALDSFLPLLQTIDVDTLRRSTAFEATNTIESVEDEQALQFYAIVLRKMLPSLAHGLARSDFIDRINQIVEELQNV